MKCLFTITHQLSVKLLFPLTFWAFLGFHSQFVGEGGGVGIDPAAADGAGAVLVMAASSAEVEKFRDFFIRPRFAAGEEVPGHSLRVGFQLSDAGKLAVAGAFHPDLCMIFRPDAPSADCAHGVEFIFFPELAIHSESPLS